MFDPQVRICGRYNSPSGFGNITAGGLSSYGCFPFALSELVARGSLFFRSGEGLYFVVGQRAVVDAQIVQHSLEEAALPKIGAVLAVKGVKDLASAIPLLLACNLALRFFS